MNDDPKDPRDPRTPKVPAREDFLALARSMQAAARPPEDLDEYDRRKQRLAREERLDKSGLRGAITPEDYEWLISDAIPLETAPMYWVYNWASVRASKTPQAGRFTTLVVVGATGRGKTVAGGWVLARNDGSRYVTAETVCRLVEAKDYRSEQKLETLLSTRCLFIDDVGTEFSAHVAQSALYEAINRRAGIPEAWTYIAGNLSLKNDDGVNELLLRYGERTIRRIDHQGLIVEVEGEDLRRKMP